MISINSGKIKINEIKDGDIIYVDIGNGINDELIGSDYFTTGLDCIFIIDDSALYHEGTFLINGGHELNLLHTDIIYKIGHYSELLQTIK